MLRGRTRIWGADKPRSEKKWKRLNLSGHTLLQASLELFQSSKNKGEVNILGLLLPSYLRSIE